MWAWLLAKLGVPTQEEAHDWVLAKLGVPSQEEIDALIQTEIVERLGVR